MPEGFAAKTHKRPVIIILICTSIIIGVWYVVMFGLAKPVTFSFNGETCVNEATLLPRQQRMETSSVFSLRYKEKWPWLATSTCFTPVKAPTKGSIALSSAPYGWALLRQHYRLAVSEPPRVTASLTTAAIAVTKPVLFQMDKPDTVYEYQIASEAKKQHCLTAGAQLSCPVKELGLSQGAEHTVTLSRVFNGKSITKVSDQKIVILPAVTVTGGTVSPNQTVYDKISSLVIHTDKPLKSASATLELVDGDKSSVIESKATVGGNDATIATAAELQREKAYRLRLSSVEAADGSTINEPYIVTFTTSGGPKVTGVNIGTSGVDPNATVVVSFDQAIDAATTAKFAQVTGVTAAPMVRSNQVSFRLSSAARCAPFNVIVTKGIVSASNGLVSKSDWSFASRINCRATATIGYSVKGRPIVAYYYGGGGTTILFTGGMHGSEPSGQQTMQAWANYLDVHAPEIPAGKQIVIVPNTNPDGIAAGTRLNANGVNIDRNFATSDWRTDIQVAGGTLRGGGGSAAMSEPETRAIANLTSQVNPSLEVSFHAQGRLVGANDVGSSRSVGSLYAATVGYSTMFGSAAEDAMGYGFSGQYEDWIGQKLGKPAILIELPSASGNYLSAQLTALWKMVNL